MSAEENKALVRRANEEAWNKGNLGVLDELYAPTCFWHNAAQFGLPADREGIKQVIGVYRAAFPDVQLTIEDVVAEGDRVAQRLTWRATHTGPLMSPAGSIPPTGKTVTVTGIGISRVEGGKIVDTWGEVDLLGMLQQLGVIPAPAQAGA